MSQEIIDLDASGVIAAPKTIKLGGVLYKLPGDVPAPLFVQLMDAATRPDDPQLTVDVHNEILALFQVHQPDLDRLPLGLNEMTAAIGVIYRGPDVAGETGDEEGPTKPSASSKKARSSRSRSST